MHCHSFFSRFVVILGTMVPVFQQPTFRAAPETLGKGLQTGLPKATVSLESFAAQARALTTLASKSLASGKERAPEATPQE